MKRYLIPALVIIVALLSAGCTQPTELPSNLTLGQRVKTSGCILSGPYPDFACTPGAINLSATKEDLCRAGYTSEVRKVSDKTKDAVYVEYGKMNVSLGEYYEVDHFIPLALGGSNDIANLWLEPEKPLPGYHEKDRVETYLHKEVCAGRMSLEEAQRTIAYKWVEVYIRLAAVP
jgi:hypothetical protein